jgi:hypothetical protein
MTNSAIDEILASFDFDKVHGFAVGIGGYLIFILALQEGNDDD